MKEVGEDLVVKNAKSVNPKVNLIIKPPNWYEQYQFSGYNLEAQPKVFDMIYCGTETRGFGQHRHAPPAVPELTTSCGINEHIKAGQIRRRLGGPRRRRQTLNRYTEQLEDTLFAKPGRSRSWCYWQRARDVADGGWDNQHHEHPVCGRRRHLRETGCVPRQTRPALWRRQLQTFFHRRARCTCTITWG